jgi:hypothetical protein
MFASPEYARCVLVFAMSKGGAVALGILVFVVGSFVAGALRPSRDPDRFSRDGDKVNEPPGFRKPPDEGGLL